jgi:O-methyltransferase
MLRKVKNLLKHSYRDTSIRSDFQGLGHLAVTQLAAQFLHVNKIQGSYLEFGVFQGGTFSNFYREFKRHDLPIMMFAFDGFQGLPEKGAVDTSSGYHEFPQGAFACSEEDFIKALASRGVPREAYTIVPGMFHESLTSDLYNTLSIPKAALINIDVDLYESTVPVLDFVLPLLQDGTLILFDEYFAWRGNPCLGERRAFREFLERNPNIEATEYAKFGVMGLAFIIHNATFS